MTITAEQLEELMADINEVGREYWPISSEELASLARRVLAAEKLVEALMELPLGDGPLARLVTAYREASK